MSDMGAVEAVGARLVLLDADTFRANLQAATEALAAFNDEQERAAELAKETAGTISDSAEESADAVKESASASADAVKAEATETVAARDAIVGAQSDIADASGSAAEKVGTASDAVVVSQGKVAADANVAAAAKVAGSWDAAVAGSTKILKWGSIVAAVVGYEGVKKFLTYNQQVTQLGINAGLSAKQLPALAAGFLKISDATGMSATNVATMAYYLASANPQIKTTTASLLAMAQQAANLDVMAGASADPTAISRMYGAVVSNAIPITVGGKAPTYSTATGTALNEWANAVTGHGDVTLGALTSALGTGILPLAKTFGLSLNQVGAMFDVLSPAMDASSAATRLKTAISMMGAPTASSRQAYELFGANATTPGAILRSKGPQAMLTYLSNMLSGKVTGSTFANAFYGSGLGAATGGTKGVGSGAGEYLRVMGFTPAQIAVMESAGGIASFAKMTPAQLQATGFAKGTTGAVAEQTVMTDFLSQMMGGGRTGAAVMQLINERGTLATKTAQIAGAENPKTYGAQLKLAFAEPIVVFHQLEQQFENLTIRIGQDVTPAARLLRQGPALSRPVVRQEQVGARSPGRDRRQHRRRCRRHQDHLGRREDRVRGQVPAHRLGLVIRTRRCEHRGAHRQHCGDRRPYWQTGTRWACAGLVAGGGSVERAASSPRHLFWGSPRQRPRCTGSTRLPTGPPNNSPGLERQRPPSLSRHHRPRRHRRSKSSATSTTRQQDRQVSSPPVVVLLLGARSPWAMRPGSTLPHSTQRPAKRCRHGSSVN